MPSTFARMSAAGGVSSWLVLLLISTADSSSIELIHKLALFGILVVVPLGLSLVAPGSQQRGLALYKLIVFAQPVAALVTIVSFFFEKGVVSASLSCAWFVLTGLVALFGFTRLVSRAAHPIEELSIDAGLLYLPVAGLWLVVYRLGVQPFGYGETIILLTVVHFHFAGFAAPIIAGMSGRCLAATQYPRRLLVLAVFAIVAAMPLVAAGITFSPLLGLIGTLLISSGLLLLAVLTVGWAIRSVVSRIDRLLLLIAAISSCVAMVLASLYAYSLAAHTVILTIPAMAMTHGLLNAFGFVTCSLLVWSRVSPSRRPDASYALQGS